MKHQRFHTTPDLSIEFEATLNEEEFIVQLETCDAVNTSLETLEVTTQGKAWFQMQCFKFCLEICFSVLYGSPLGLYTDTNQCKCSILI